MRSWNLQRKIEIGLIASAIVLMGAFASFADDKVKFVVGQDVDAIEDYIKTFHHQPDGVMAYTSLQDVEGLWEEADHGGGTQFAQKLLDEYPGTFLQLGLYLVDILPDIPHGKYDDNLHRLAKWLKSLKRPVYLRIGYEFDNPANRYDPEQYIRAYHYIVDFLKTFDVMNVEYVWHSYAAYVDGGNIKRWYPGDDYVDWIAVSFYDAYSSGFRRDVVRIAMAHHKPLMIAESTPYKIGVMKSEQSWWLWFRKYFEFIQENDVKMFCYINWDWEQYPLFSGQGWGNGRIQDNPYIKEKWIEQLKKSGYIQP